MPAWQWTRTIFQRPVSNVPKKTNTMKISFVPATSAFVMAALATGALGRAGAFPAPETLRRPAASAT